MNVGALVALVTAVRYFYMGEFWVLICGSPTVYRSRLIGRSPFPRRCYRVQADPQGSRVMLPDVSAGMFCRSLLCAGEADFSLFSRRFGAEAAAGGAISALLQRGSIGMHLYYLYICLFI